MQKFYVDKDGKYIGSYDGANPPEGAIEVETAPKDSKDVWSGREWLLAHPPNLPSFVLDVLLDPTFSDREVMQVQGVSSITDPFKRDALIVQLVSQATPTKQQRLLELAAQYSIPLPPLGGQ